MTRILYAPGAEAAVEAWDTWHARLDELLQGIGRTLRELGLNPRAIRRAELVEAGADPRSILRVKFVRLTFDNVVELHVSRDAVVLPPTRPTTERTTP